MMSFVLAKNLTFMKDFAIGKIYLLVAWLPAGN